MFQEAYKKQVALLLAVLPEVAKEECFALFGGTAINLFIRNMPRLSIDIDLTYVPIENRATSLANISAALERISARIQKIISGARVAHRQDVGKLLISGRRRYQAGGQSGRPRHAGRARKNATLRQSPSRI